MRIALNRKVAVLLALAVGTGTLLPVVASASGSTTTITSPKVVSQFHGPFVLSGPVHIGSVPVTGAKIKVIGPRGNNVPLTIHKKVDDLTSSLGTYIVIAKTLPSSFTVEAIGGMAGKKQLGKGLIRGIAESPASGWSSPAIYTVVNELTNLDVLYKMKHAKATLSSASAAIHKALSIPAKLSEFTPSDIVRRPYINGSSLLQVAQKHGGLEKYSKNLVDKIDKNPRKALMTFDATGGGTSAPPSGCQSTVQTQNDGAATSYASATYSLSCLYGSVLPPQPTSIGSNTTAVPVTITAVLNTLFGSDLIVAQEPAVPIFSQLGAVAAIAATESVYPTFATIVSGYDNIVPPSTTSSSFTKITPLVTGMAQVFTSTATVTAAQLNAAATASISVPGAKASVASVDALLSDVVANPTLAASASESSNAEISEASGIVLAYNQITSWLKSSGASILASANAAAAAAVASNSASYSSVNDWNNLSSELNTNSSAYSNFSQAATAQTAVAATSGNPGAFIGTIFTSASALSKILPAVFAATGGVGALAVGALAIGGLVYAGIQDLNGSNALAPIQAAITQLQTEVTQLQSEVSALKTALDDLETNEAYDTEIFGFNTCETDITSDYASLQSLDTSTPGTSGAGTLLNYINNSVVTQLDPGAPCSPASLDNDLLGQNGVTGIALLASQQRAETASQFYGPSDSNAVAELFANLESVEEEDATLVASYACANSNGLNFISPHASAAQVLGLTCANNAAANLVDTTLATDIAMEQSPISAGGGLYPPVPANAVIWTDGNGASGAAFSSQLMYGNSTYIQDANNGCYESNSSVNSYNYFNGSNCLDDVLTNVFPNGQGLSAIPSNAWVGGSTSSIPTMPNDNWNIASQSDYSNIINNANPNGTSALNTYLESQTSPASPFQPFQAFTTGADYLGYGYNVNQNWCWNGSDSECANQGAVQVEGINPGSWNTSSNSNWGGGWCVTPETGLTLSIPGLFQGSWSGPIGDLAEYWWESPAGGDDQAPWICPDNNVVFLVARSLDSGESYYLNP